MKILTILEHLEQNMTRIVKYCSKFKFTHLNSSKMTFYIYHRNTNVGIKYSNSLKEFLKFSQLEKNLGTKHEINIANRFDFSHSCKMTISFLHFSNAKKYMQIFYLFFANSRNPRKFEQNMTSIKKSS